MSHNHAFRVKITFNCTRCCHHLQLFKPSSSNNSATSHRTVSNAFFLIRYINYFLLLLVRLFSSCSLPILNVSRFGKCYQKEVRTECLTDWRSECHYARQCSSLSVSKTPKKKQMTMLTVVGQVQLPFLSILISSGASNAAIATKNHCHLHYKSCATQ